MTRKPSGTADGKQSEKIPMTAGILAGGKSARMGENKAFLSWKGTTFLEHILKQVKEFSQVLISVADREQLTVPVIEGGNQPERKISVFSMDEELMPILVEDEKKEYGPLEGLYQLLRHAKYPWVFIAATDMPLLNQNLIKELLMVDRENVQAVIIRENPEQGGGQSMSGKVHPLCGLYHVSCMPALEKLFAAEQHSMRSLLSCIRVKYISTEELHVDARILTNVNAPSEYQALFLEERSAQKAEEKQGGKVGK